MRAECRNQRTRGRDLFTTNDRRRQRLLQLAFCPFGTHCHISDIFMVAVRKYRCKTLVFASRRVGLVRSAVFRVHGRNNPNRRYSLGKSVCIIYNIILKLYVTFNNMNLNDNLKKLSFYIQFSWDIAVFIRVTYLSFEL